MKEQRSEFITPTNLSDNEKNNNRLIFYEYCRYYIL